jgi:L-glutamine-phosphate cytidylyltransferase
MRAIVLAAGCGSRMAALTRRGPKCLLALRGATLLDRQVAAFRRIGAQRIGVVGGWHVEALRGRGVEVLENARWREGTMVGSLCRAHDWLAADTTLVSYGDIAFCHRTVARLAAAPEPLAVAYDPRWRALWSRRFEDPLDDAETFAVDGAGHLLDIGGPARDADRIAGQYIGLMRWTPEAWARYGPILQDLQERERGRRVDMTGALRLLVRDHGAAIATVPIAGPWFEFDSAHDVRVGTPVLDDIDRLLGATT